MARNLIVAITCGLAWLATASTAYAQRNDSYDPSTGISGRCVSNCDPEPNTVGSGGYTADQQAMLNLAGNLGSLFGGMIRQSFVDGERQAEADAQHRAYEAEQARQRALAEEAERQRRNQALLANMKGAVGSVDLRPSQLGSGQLKMRTTKDMFDNPAETPASALDPGSWSAYYNALQRRDAAAVTHNARESDLAVAQRLVLEAERNAADHPGPEADRILAEARVLRDRAQLARDTAKADLDKAEVILKTGAAERDRALNVNTDPSVVDLRDASSTPALLRAPSAIVNRGPQYSDPNTQTSATGARADASDTDQQQEAYLGGVKPTYAQVDEALNAPDFAGVPISGSAIESIRQAPDYLPVEERAPLTMRWEAVARNYTAVALKRDQLEEVCPDDFRGSAKCKSDAESVDRLLKEYRENLEAYALQRDVAAGQFTLKSINGWALQSGWSDLERNRLSNSLNRLDEADPADAAWDFDAKRARDRAQEIWSQAAKSSAGYKDALASAKGPNLNAAGLQEKDDCAVYALATATGRPYEEVEQRALAIIKDAAWREQVVRNNPQLVLKNGGLNGGEVILLAEEYGRSTVIAPSQFSSTVAAGRPVMVHVIAEHGGDHEVVLSRTFQSNGKTYFEVIDSARKRSVVIAEEDLKTVILENGVAFSPG